MPTTKEIDIKRLKQSLIESEASKCCKHRVGCIITDSNGRICGSGYNGTPSGQENCSGVFGDMKDVEPEAFRHNHRIWSQSHEIHAEINALLHSDQKDYRGGTMYLTHPPCKSCALAIAASGICVLVYIKRGMTTSFNQEQYNGRFVIREYNEEDIL